VGNTTSSYTSDYVSKNGFHCNGASTSSIRYIKYTPSANGTLTVKFKSNNTSDNNRTSAIGTAVGSPIVTAKCSTGSMSASVSAGKTYYIYFVSGGQTITSITFTASGSSSSSTSSGSSSSSSSTAASGLCIFTGSKPSMSAVSVTGNYSTSKGSVTINGTKYTTCVKMESSTSVKVTVSGTQTVKLYFDGASKSFKVNGSSKTTSSSGTWSGTFTSGTMTITKGDSMNLYAIEFSNSSNSLDPDFGSETAIEEVQEFNSLKVEEGKKVLLNGNLVILKDGKTFNLAGQEM
jgi:hypothetical protein